MQTTTYIIRALGGTRGLQRGGVETPERMLLAYASRRGFVADASSATLLSEHTLEAALQLHTGDDDVPAATKPALHQLLGEMQGGAQLVQLKVVVEHATQPARRGRMQVAPAPVVPDRPGLPATCAVGVRTLSRLTGLGRRIGEWVRAGDLTTTEVRRSGRDDQYVVVDDVLKAKMAEAGVREVLPPVALGGWVEPAHLAATLAAGGIEVSPAGTVAATFEWLAFALRYQPAYERHRVATGQIVGGRTLAEQRRVGRDPWTLALFDEGEPG